MHNIYLHDDASDIMQNLNLTAIQDEYFFPFYLCFLTVVIKLGVFVSFLCGHKRTVIILFRNFMSLSSSMVALHGIHIHNYTLNSELSQFAFLHFFLQFTSDVV